MDYNPNRSDGGSTWFKVVSSDLERCRGCPGGRWGHTEGLGRDVVGSPRKFFQLTLSQRGDEFGLSRVILSFGCGVVKEPYN